MKHLLTLSLLVFTVASCKKEAVTASSNTYLQQVKQELKDSVTATDFVNLDFSKARLSAVDSVGLYLLRIPFKGKDIATDFVLLQTGPNGNIQRGRMVQLQKTAGEEKGPSFNGTISLYSLDRTAVLQSAIRDGYIEAFHPQNNSRAAVKLPDNNLQEVVVIGYYDSGGVSYSDWTSLLSYFRDSESGNCGYYSPVNLGGDGNINSGGSGGAYEGGSGGSSNLENGIFQDPVLEMEAEYMYFIPVVQLSKMFRCFDYVPSGGASYSIRLCTDIPNNQNPNMSANFSSASAGHTFLTITKSNGSTRVTQSFGFYPSQEPSLLDPFATVPAAIKDNGFQEINASIEMNIKESEFSMVKQSAIALAAKSYELSDYNCTSFALDIFNSVRTNPIQLQSYHVILPGNSNPYSPIEGPIEVAIKQSPQMLFLCLQNMKSNSAEAPNIKIDRTHSYNAPVSQGECN